MQTESGKSILLVEDMAIIAMAQASILKKNGFEVIIAYNGNEAIKLASENPTLDLILMDIDLGKGIDGTEAAQIILKTHEIPIVFLSNHTEKEIVEKTEKITSYGYVVKNSGETVLLASIKMAFKLFEAHQLRFESEKKLLESDKKFHILEKQIDDVIWTMDMNFRLTYISPSVEKMHGYTVDEMMKLNLQDYLTEESAQKAIDVLGEEISSYLKDKIEKNIVTIEIDQRKKGGTIFPTEIRARFLLDEHGLPSGMIGVSRDISQRHKDEKALRDSEKTLSLALEGAQIGLWDQNFKTGTVLRSNLWATMLGYQPEELDTSIDFWKSHIHPDDLQVTLDEAKKHEEGFTEFFKVRHRLRCKNGNFKWILNWGKISERDESGKPVRALGIHLDIDENKQIEESLKLSEERLRYALEGNSDGIWDWNLKTGAVYFSPRYYTMLGYQPYEFLPSYDKWKELIHPDDFVESEAAVFSAIEKLNPFSIEFRLRKKDGSYCWILARGKVAEKDSDGKALRISGSHTDINERKLSEEALKKNENKLNSIFKAAPVGIGMTSNRVLLEVNDTMCKMLGYNCNELIGNSALMLYPTKEEYEFVGNEKYEQIKKYGTGTVETKWVCKNGKIIDVLLSSTPLNLSDVSGGVTFTALDITERKKTEFALKESQQMLQNVLDKFPGVVFWKDVNSIYLGCNLSFAIAAGFKNADEIIGKTDFDLPWAKTEAKKYQADDKLVMNSGVAKLNIIETQHQSGNKIAWFDTNKIPLIDDLGKLYGVLGTSTNITNRKEAEEALRISEERYSLAQKAANIGSWDWNMLTDELSWSELVIPMFGLKPGEFKGTMADFWSRLHPDDIPMIEEKIKATIEKNENYRVEHRVIHPDGNIRWMLETGNVFNDKDGKAYRMLGMVQDITERKTAEELLRNSEANLNSLVNNRNEAIWSIDNSYNFIFVNNFFKQEFLKAFNFELKRGMNSLSILAPEQAEFWKQKYDSVLSGEYLTFRFSNQFKNDLKFYEVTLTPIFSDGDVLGVSALSQDITARKKAEEEVLFRKEELERFEKIVIGRELKMIELKEKLTEMEQRLKEYQKNAD
jgi:PAS domain S-box-containing protein